MSDISITIATIVIYTYFLIQFLLVGMKRLNVINVRSTAGFFYLAMAYFDPGSRFGGLFFWIIFTVGLMLFVLINLINSETVDIYNVNEQNAEGIQGLIDEFITMHKLPSQSIQLYKALYRTRIKIYKVNFLTRRTFKKQINQYIAQHGNGRTRTQIELLIIFMIITTLFAVLLYLVNR